MIWREWSRVLRTSVCEGPLNMSIMSSAKMTISRFGRFVSFSIRSLIMMFHRVGPDTDPCGHPLVTFFSLEENPMLQCADRLLMKSRSKLYMLVGHFSFRSSARRPGCQALSKAPTISRARRQHL